MLLGFMAVQWKLNRRLLIWLSMFTVIGIIVGIMTMFNARLNVRHISEGLLDKNILRVIRPSATIGAVLMGRLTAFALTFALIFIVCLNRWTTLFVFPIAVYHGFAMVINLYWAIARFGAAMGAPLLIVYFILLPILCFLKLCAMVYCMKNCRPMCKTIHHGLLLFAIAAVAIALVECLFFWLILSKIVFVI